MKTTSNEDELLCRYLDGKLTEGEKIELQELLRHNASARKRLRILALVTESISGREVPVKLQQNNHFQKILPWGIAIAASIVAMLSWINHDTDKNQKTESVVKPTQPQQKEKIVALLVNKANAKFTKGNPTDEVSFRKGNYELESGSIHLRFANGADVLIQAPATFHIEDHFNMRLEKGKMRAIVPPSAKGFTIATPGIDYEDLGTEFGLSVDQNSGASRLDVFDGQVDAKDPASKKLLSSVLGGESLKFSDGSLQSVTPDDPNQYPTPHTVGFHRWQHQYTSMQKNDPDLIGHYPFHKAEKLENKAATPVTSDGKIQGARWVSGRWPDKPALLFDRDTDFVELDIPGTYDELSFATWVKLDRFNFSHNSIFNSNGWSGNDVHWQFRRNGMMWIDIFGRADKKITKESQPVLTNQWVHLVGTISRKSKTSRVYINGKLAGAFEFKSDVPFQPGTGRIGGWRMESDWPRVPLRGMKGKMDEFSIWKRALTETEIQNLVNIGKPSTLWAMSQ